MTDNDFERGRRERGPNGTEGWDRDYPDGERSGREGGAGPDYTREEWERGGKEGDRPEPRDEEDAGKRPGTAGGHA